MRVAVTQFATSSNVQDNLASCIRLINEAATCKPSLIVLPEFCNTSFANTLSSNTLLSNTRLDTTQLENKSLDKTHSNCTSYQQVWHEALDIDGPFLQAIAQQAKQHNCYIVINVTLRQGGAHDVDNNEQGELAQSQTSADNTESHAENTNSYISSCSCLYSPLGEIIYQKDKQRFTAQENDFFIDESKMPEAISTPVGKLALLAGPETLTFEASRDLALNGAQLLCNSISTFALDQSEIHDPARAVENNIYLATANKVGSLTPKHQVTKEQEEQEEQDYISQQALFCTNTAVGQSQIVSPKGHVLAKLNSTEEGFTYADIDLSGAEQGATTEIDSTSATDTQLGFNNKCRPDGSQLSKQLRPELYQKLSESIKHKSAHHLAQSSDVPVTANVAIFATYKSNEQAIEDVCHYIENNLSDIIQLPELFFIADKSITHDAQQRDQITCLSKQLIEQVSAVLRPFQYLCTSVIIEGIHQAVLISNQGILATQQQLHFCQRYQWTALGNELNIVELALEQGNIRLAMLTADDANIAEMIKLAALSGIHLLLVPFDIQEPCEVAHSILARAAENRVCIVAASREKSFTANSPTKNTNNNIYSKNKVKAQKSTGLIANLTTESRLLPQWQAQKFNGYINQPLVKLQYGKITKAVIHPIAACTKRLNITKN